MSWKCPSCGCQNQATYSHCSCGYHGNGNILVKQELNDYQGILESGGECSDTPSDCTSDAIQSLQEPPKDHDMQAPERSEPPNATPGEEVIKTIDSWLFTFAHGDNCLSIGTPALQSFRLKISTEDLEELLELLYQKTNSDKTIRKSNLSATDIIGVIDKVDRLIDEKKSKISIQFTSDELQEITDFINVQLKI